MKIREAIWWTLQSSERYAFWKIDAQPLHNHCTNVVAII